MSTKSKLLVIVAIVVMCACLTTGCTETDEFTDIEKEIIDQSCKQFDVVYDSQSNIQMILVYKGTPEWSDYECRDYVIRVDSYVFQVGVQLNDEGIHLVDVYSCQEVIE